MHVKKGTGVILIHKESEIESHSVMSDSLWPQGLGILQARILEWVAFPFSKRSSQPRNRTQLSRIEGGFFTNWATRKECHINKLRVRDKFKLWEGYTMVGFPGDSNGKESACNAGDLGSIPGSGRSPGEGNGSPLQYPCPENPMDRGAWRATVSGAAKSQTQLSN